MEVIAFCSSGDVLLSLFPFRYLFTPRPCHLQLQFSSPPFPSITYFSALLPPLPSPPLPSPPLPSPPLPSPPLPSPPLASPPLPSPPLPFFPLPLNVYITQLDGTVPSFPHSIGVASRNYACEISCMTYYEAMYSYVLP